MTIDEMDALIGFGKPASKTADWIVNTYLPNAPVSYRLSIEHAIAAAILESKAASPGPSELVEEMEALVQELREKRDRNGTTGYAAGLHECADRFSALITRHRGKS